MSSQRIPYTKTLSQELPEDGGSGVEERHGLTRCAAEPLGDALRPDIRGRDDRDEPLDAEAPGPLAHSAGGLGRVAVAPVLTDQRPAELRLRVLARVRVRGGRPRARVPDVQPRTTDDDAVFDALRDQWPDPVRLPALQPPPNRKLG